MKKRFIGAIVLVLSLLLAVVVIASSIEPLGTECVHYGVADAYETNEIVNEYQYTESCCYKVYKKTTRRCSVCGNLWGIYRTLVSNIGHTWSPNLIDPTCSVCGYVSSAE